MAFDVDQHHLCDIIQAYVDEFEATGLTIANFALVEGLTFEQALEIIQIGKNLPKNSL